jgi:hypothetical protein
LFEERGREREVVGGGGKGWQVLIKVLGRKILEFNKDNGP